MKKVFRSLVLALTAAAMIGTALPISAAAETPTTTATTAADTKTFTVTVNGTEVKPFTDTDGTIYLPLFDAAKAMGYTQTAVNGKDNTVKSYVFKNGTRTVKYNQSAYSCSVSGPTHFKLTTQLTRTENNILYMDAESFCTLFAAAETKTAASDTIAPVTENTVKIVSKKYKTAKKLNTTIYYPVISGTDSTAAEKIINGAFKHAAAALAKAAKKDSKGASRYSCSMNYSVVYNQKGLLSVLFDTYEYMGGAHGIDVRTGMTFNLSTGKAISYKKLFSDVTAANKIVDAAVSAEIANREKNDSLYSLSPFKTVGTKPTWCLTNDGLKILFDEYEYFPYAAGIQTFVIPYASLSAVLADQTAVLAK